MTLNYGENSLEQEFQCYAAISCIEQTLKELMAGDLSTAVRTISSGIDTLRKLADLASKTQNVELREGILELREQLLTLKEELLAAKEENLELRDQNKVLTERVFKLEQGVKEALTFDKHGYYKPDGDGPFCTGCYDSNQKAIRLSKLSGDARTFGEYQCPACKNVYGQAR